MLCSFKTKTKKLVVGMKAESQRTSHNSKMQLVIYRFAFLSFFSCNLCGEKHLTLAVIDIHSFEYKLCVVYIRQGLKKCFFVKDSNYLINTNSSACIVIVHVCITIFFPPSLSMCQIGPAGSGSWSSKRSEKYYELQHFPPSSSDSSSNLFFPPQKQIIVDPLSFSEERFRPSLEERLESIISGAALMADSSCTRDDRRERIVAECNSVRQALQDLLSEYMGNVSVSPITAFCCSHKSLCNFSHYTAAQNLSLGLHFAK